MRTLLIIAMSVAGLASSRASAETLERRAGAIHVGWWNLEGEVRASSGLFADVGIPWLLFIAENDQALPLGAKIGYDIPVARRLGLRAGVRALGLVSGLHARGYAGLFEVGLRYEHPSGLVAGVDVPLFAFLPGEHEDDSDSGLPPPQSLALSQAYVGFAWGF